MSLARLIIGHQVLQALNRCFRNQYNPFIYSNKYRSYGCDCNNNCNPFVNGCTGLSKTFDITVNPNPTVNSTPNLVKCNTVSSGVINFSGNASGTTLTGRMTQHPSAWQQQEAATSSVLPQRIRVNISYSNHNGYLKKQMVVLELKTFTITVNPTPTVDLPLSQTVCNGQSSAVILFSGAKYSIQLDKQ
jgi:hypothetical protein